jgi:hypothetical protein
MDTLLKILNETTALTTDVDLFAYEIPLDKHGVWLADAQIDSRFNGTGRQEFDIYVRFKTKTSGMANVEYLKNTIDALSGSSGTCKLADGTTFKLGLMYQWEYLEKDAEGYFVWANRVMLII